MEKFDRIMVKSALFLVIVSLLAVPIGVWYYQKVSIPNQYPAGTKVFNITGYGELGQWTLDNVDGTNYWRGAGERLDNLVVNKGDKVVLRLTSADVFHSFAIPDLGIQSDFVKAGHITEVSFVADKAGIYTFRCRETCSPAHPAMFGTLTVIDN